MPPGIKPVMVNETIIALMDRVNFTYVEIYLIILELEFFMIILWSAEVSRDCIWRGYDRDNLHYNIKINFLIENLSEYLDLAELATA